MTKTEKEQIRKLTFAGLFFLFMQRDKEQISRGILLSSLVCLIAIFVYMFLL